MDTRFAPVGLDGSYRVFISEDPIGIEGGINLYGYVSDDPINANDPEGLFGYKEGVPPASQELLSFLQCLQSCVNWPFFVVTATTNGHGKETPHGKGKAIDIRYPENPDKFLCCAAKCGAGCGIDEKKHPSKGSTGPHLHLQLTPCKGGRMDLPPGNCCK
jgi:hypothetical protein